MILSQEASCSPSQPLSTVHRSRVSVSQCCPTAYNSIPTTLPGINVSVSVDAKRYSIWVFHLQSSFLYSGPSQLYFTGQQVAFISSLSLVPVTFPGTSLVVLKVENPAIQIPSSIADNNGAHDLSIRNNAQTVRDNIHAGAPTVDSNVIGTGKDSGSGYEK